MSSPFAGSSPKADPPIARREGSDPRSAETESLASQIDRLAAESLAAGGAVAERVEPSPRADIGGAGLPTRASKESVTGGKSPSLMGQSSSNDGEPNAGVSQTAPSGRSSGGMPHWYPHWAERLATAYLSGTSCVFLLHGNVRDLVELGPATSAYGTLSEFIARDIFGRWDIVLGYDVGKGIRPLAGPDAERLRSMAQWMSSKLGHPTSWPREPDQALAALDAILDRNLIDGPEDRKRIAIVLDHAQYLAPAGDVGASIRSGAGRLVRLLSWATNPLLRRVNVAIVLVADSLSEVHPRLVQSPAVTVVELPLPDATARERFALATSRSVGFSSDQTEAVKRAATLSAGLSLESLRAVLTMSARLGTSPDGDEFARQKKDLIERSCRGLVEFIEPRLTLAAVAGHEHAKERLETDARAIRRGQFEVAPMGYLICGPVGTGKSFIAECYAGSVGIPCAVLRNFRSKYVGETEGNLEHALGVLRSLGPVVVMIDEADAALGNRQADGDSGTSARVFSMIARQMGDTRYRGKIVWMLLTSRPDLLPIDLKRQGRAEVHIPLFYPHDQSEIDAMFMAMSRKCGVPLDPDLPGPVDTELGLSGADIEGIVLAARRSGLEEAVVRGEPPPATISRSHLRRAIEDFLPSAQGLEKEMQEIAAVLECTDKRFLPERWAEKVARQGGRAVLQERLAAIREVIGS
ncbi:MAG: ATP-binding protein [Planctomycetaceae bacterium]